MKHHKTILAAAVAAAVGAPAAQAEITAYGRVNNALDLNSLAAGDDAASSTHLSSVASRFGLRGETELDSGLKVHGRYEFSTGSDNESGPSDVRIATAGMSGGFGRVDVGNQWSAYYNTFGTHFDPFYTLGYYLYSSAGGGLYRGSNTIKYSNSWGGVSMQFDLRMNDTETGHEGASVGEKARGQGFGIGVSFKAGPNLTIGAAYDVEGRPAAARAASVTVAPDTGDDDGITTTVTEAGVTMVSPDETRLGVAINWNSGGGFHFATGFQSYSVDGEDITVSADGMRGTEDDATGGTPVDVPAGTIVDSTADVSSFFIRLGGSMSPKTSWLVRYASAGNGNEEGQLKIDRNAMNAIVNVTPDVNVSGEAKGDATDLTWGVYHNAGGGLRLYYEGTMLTNDAANQDGARHLFGIRVDF